MAELKLKGATLVEVLVSFTIIAICIGLTMFIFSDVPASFKLIQRIHADIAIENIMQEIEHTGKIPHEITDKGKMKINIEAGSYQNYENLVVVKIVADFNNQVLCKRQRVFLMEQK